MFEGLDQAQLSGAIEAMLFVTDEPVDEVDTLPTGCYCIVMTHNHALDLELSAALLKRNDFTYFGLIGSKTKRVKFEHRLRDRGFSPQHLQRLRCPMGLSSSHSPPGAWSRSEAVAPHTANG